jgi:hypothetical protein
MFVHGGFRLKDTAGETGFHGLRRRRISTRMNWGNFDKNRGFPGLRAVDQVF